MQQQYELGKYLRQRYIEGRPYRFLDGMYNRRQVVVRSTDFDRTLMSAYSNLAGFFPPNGSQVWSKDIAWQPIPVHTVPVKTDYLLSTDVPCPRYNKEMEKVYQSDYVKEEERLNKDFYEFVNNVTGRSHEGIKNVWDIYDTLFCEKTLGLKLPEWVNRTWKGMTTYDKLNLLHDLSFRLEFAWKPILWRLRGGPLLGTFVNNMKLATNVTLRDSNPKAYLYSAHDSTVCALTSAMGVYNGISPPYRATVIVELLRQNGQYFVEVLYRNDTSRDPYQLVLPGCTFSCPLDQFVNLTASSIPTDIVAECQTSFLQSPYLWFGVSLLFMGVTGILLILFAIVVILRRRRGPYDYKLLDSVSS